MGTVARIGRTLRRNAVRRGFVGGRRGWVTVGVLTYGWRVLRRVMRGREETVTLEHLRPGESIVIESVPKERRRGRRSRAGASE